MSEAESPNEPTNPYEALPKTPANYAPLTPILFLERAALVYPQRAAMVHAVYDTRGPRHFYAHEGSLRRS